MKTLVSVLAILLSGPPEEKALPTTGPVYVIPVQGEIEWGLVHQVARGVREAEKNGASLIVVDMDTPGGRVDATTEIMKILSETPIPTRTFVDTWAMSAGAYIAVATDRIFMAPRSAIGAATPIASGPLSGAQELPAAVEEKMTSALAATIASTAEAKGHPVEIVRAMVDRDVEIPDPEKPGSFIIEKGKLLTLTNVEAERPEIALSRGTVADIDRLLEREGAAGAEVVRVEPSPAEKLARFLTSSAVSVILLLGGLGGLYLEFKTPGFGFFGVAGLVLLGLFFFGHYIAGLAGFEEAAVFGIGLILLAVELFVTPGFGFMGAAGIGLILGGLVAAMARGPLIRPGSGLNLDYTDALETMGMAMAGVFLLAAGASRLLVRQRSPIARRLVLANRESGFKASTEPAGIVPGSRGVTVTKLRPAGIALFRGKRLDVVSQGEVVPSGEAVEVVTVSGNRVVVRKERKEPSLPGKKERAR